MPTEEPLVKVMAGVTISCPEPHALVEMLIHIFGWELISEGEIGRELEDLWGVQEGSAGDKWTILRSQNSKRGMIRVIKGKDRKRTKPIGTRWSGVEIVVMNQVDELFEKLKDHPSFDVLSEPTTFDFSDVGANIHRGFHGKGPGKTHLMFTMEVTKPTGGYDFPSAEGVVGHIFSVPLVSTTYKASLEFYRDDIHMIPVLTDHLVDGLWHQVWKLPTGTAVDLSILKGDAPGFGLGGIELQGYDTAHVDPIPYQRDLFDGGTCLTSYTTLDIDKTHETIKRSRHAEIISPLTFINQPPYNGVRSFCFLGPSGERVEISERDWNP